MTTTTRVRARVTKATGTEAAGWDGNFGEPPHFVLEIQGALRAEETEVVVLTPEGAPWDGSTRRIDVEADVILIEGDGATHEIVRTLVDTSSKTRWLLRKTKKSVPTRSIRVR